MKCKWCTRLREPIYNHPGYYYCINCDGPINRNHEHA